MSKLKACPFCSNSNVLLLLPTSRKEDRYDPRDRAFPLVWCRQCNAEVKGIDWDHTGLSAVSKWNRRDGASHDH